MVALAHRNCFWAKVYKRGMEGCLPGGVCNGRMKRVGWGTISNEGRGCRREEDREGMLKAFACRGGMTGVNVEVGLGNKC